MMCQMIIVVHMPLRLCQGVEQDCFVHNNIQHGLAVLSHVGIFFLFVPFSTFSLSVSLVPVCVYSLYPLRRSVQSLQRWQLPSNVEAANQKKRTWSRSMGHASGRERDTHRQAQEERERKEILKERARACVHVRYIRSREENRERNVYLNVCVCV